MPAQSSFDYAVLRIVPRVEREEFINAGVILFCLEKQFLQSRVKVDEKRLLALCPQLDLDLVQSHVQAFSKVCEADPNAGLIAKLPQRERFHWLVAPRSTIIQVSPVHSGLCEAPEEALDRLFLQLVAL